MCLEGKPQGTHNVSDPGGSLHDDNAKKDVLVVALEADAAEKGHGNEADEISSGRSYHLTDAPLEAGKDRKSYGSKQQIEQVMKLMMNGK